MLGAEVLTGHQVDPAVNLLDRIPVVTGETTRHADQARGAPVNADCGLCTQAFNREERELSFVVEQPIEGEQPSANDASVLGRHVIEDHGGVVLVDAKRADAPTVPLDCAVFVMKQMILNQGVPKRE